MIADILEIPFRDNGIITETKNTVITPVRTATGDHLRVPYGRSFLNKLKFIKLVCVDIGGDIVEHILGYPKEYSFNKNMLSNRVTAQTYNDIPLFPISVIYYKDELAMKYGINYTGPIKKYLYLLGCNAALFHNQADYRVVISSHEFMYSRCSALKVIPIDHRDWWDMHGELLITTPADSTDTEFLVDEFVGMGSATDYLYDMLIDEQGEYDVTRLITLNAINPSFIYANPLCKLLSEQAIIHLVDLLPYVSVNYRQHLCNTWVSTNYMVHGFDMNNLNVVSNTTWCASLIDSIIANIYTDVWISHVKNSSEAIIQVESKHLHVNNKFNEKLFAFHEIYGAYEQLYHVELTGFTLYKSWLEEVFITLNLSDGRVIHEYFTIPNYDLASNALINYEVLSELNQLSYI